MSPKPRKRKVWTGCAVGPKGSGKSFWSKKFVRKYRRDVLIFDATGEYEKGGPEGIPGIATHRSLRTYFDQVRAGRISKKNAIGADWRSFEAFCRYAFTRGNCLVVIEEVSRYLAEAKSSRAFFDLCDRSRHVGVDLLCIVSRPALLPTTFRSQVDEYVAFQTSEPTDLKFWREARGQAAADSIRNLMQYEHKTL